MKLNHQIRILAVTALLSLTACSDFLDVEITDSIRPQNFYQNESQMEQAMAGLYHTLLPVPQYRFILSEIRSDNVWVQQQKTDAQYAIAYFINDALPTTGMVQNAWSDYSTIIATANAIIDNIDGARFTEEKYKNEYRAEARFLRALAYFDMVRFFGNLPIATTSLVLDDAFMVGQSPAKDVYEQVIIPDLQYACDNLLEVATRYDGKTDAATGRATKMAAKALLGEVYLTMAGFPLLDDAKKLLAKDLFQEVVDYAKANSKYTVTTISEWNSMWIHENDNKYFIFEIQHAIDTDTSQGNTLTPWSVDRWSGSYYGGTKNQLKGNSGCYPFVEPKLRDHFLEKDATTGSYIDGRCEGTITVKNSSGSTINPSSTNAFYYTKFWENKVKREACGFSDMTGSLNDDVYTWPQNFPIMRLENVKLYLAEILGRDGGGLTYLNDIRTVAGLKNYTAADFIDEQAYQDAVADERRYELAEEGFRWFDLVRLNKWQTALKTMFMEDSEGVDNDALPGYANNVQDYTYLYPIPEAQLNVRQGLYKQNPGYAK